MINFSFAIPVKDELDEIKRLIPFLLEHKNENDEIVVLWDIDGDLEVDKFLVQLGGKIIYAAHEFKGHFADMKNHLTEICNKDWVIQLDADEMIHPILIEFTRETININPGTEAYFIPRINTVEGLTQEYINKWGWNITAPFDYDVINFPDYQQRIYINNDEVKWKNKVHEVLEGHKKFSIFPNYEELCIIHNKQLDRQIKQNDYYNTL